MYQIKRALVSVSDKTGLVEFARGLAEVGIALISTGGTAKALADAGIPHQSVSDITQFPEMLEGRVKTLHPAVHAGILADRAKPEHLQAIAAQGIAPIDLVVVNLYPFAQTIARPGVTFEEAIENIDIGGPSMVRSAAKNQASVAVVVSPSDYRDVLDDLRRSHGTLSQETRSRLAAKAFAQTAAYDAMIADYLRHRLPQEGETLFPATLTLPLSKVQDLRYGENPHQRAAFYEDIGHSVPGIASAQQLNGKELSFNNIFDLNAAYNLVREFAKDSDAAVAIIKHTNPCGAALGQSLTEAFRRAYAGDPISAFGGILAASRPMDLEIAEEIMRKSKFEAIIAPSFDADAVKTLTTKKKWGADLILLETSFGKAESADEYDYKRVNGGFLAQTPDMKTTTVADLSIASRREPTEQEVEDLLFAWKVVKHVKSNAIVLAKNGQVIGVGAGQMNRVQSVRLAVEQAGDKAQGAVLASDAFFPFDDGPEVAGKAGVTAIIHPGGSKKDADTIAMADSYTMAMILTGIRHFRH